MISPTEEDNRDQSSVLRRLSNTELGNIDKRPLSLPVYPVQTVAIERDMQSVTWASATVMVR